MDRQEIIERLFDYYEHPRHYGPLEGADLVQSGGIPDCGDTVTLYLTFDVAGARLSGMSFEGCGCTISQAAASLLCEQLQGASLDAIDALDDHAILTMLGHEGCGPVRAALLWPSIRSSRHWCAIARDEGKGSGSF